MISDFYLNLDRYIFNKILSCKGTYVIQSNQNITQQDSLFVDDPEHP
jgi:hypothetical protein